MQHQSELTTRPGVESARKGDDPLSDTPFPLNPDEQIIRQGATIYLRSTFTGIGYNPMHGMGWITNQRLMWQTTAYSHRRQLGMNYNPVAFPIKRITAIDVMPMKVQWTNETVVRLIFDNGGKEYFVFKEGADAWADALTQAKAIAPDVPYQTMPTTRPGVEGARQRAWLYLAGLVVGIPLVCGAICAVLAVIGSFLPD